MIVEITLHPNLLNFKDALVEFGIKQKASRVLLVENYLTPIPFIFMRRSSDLNSVYCMNVVTGEYLMFVRKNVK